MTTQARTRGLIFFSSFFSLLPYPSLPMLLSPFVPFFDEELRLTLSPPFLFLLSLAESLSLSPYPFPASYLSLSLLISLSLSLWTK